MTDCVSIGRQGNELQSFINMARNADLDSRPADRIHSGHFMISCVNEDDADGLDIAPSPTRVKEEEAVTKEETPIVVDESRAKGYNFNDASRQPSDSYQFGSRSTNELSIDASLATLFKHMTLAYSGKISSPKWKNFRGIKVNVKDKIRLNNIIWREWHMQYRQRRKPVICQFEAPISEKTHSKPEAVVLEGKYWKRRLDCLTTEYKKWRLFYKNRYSQGIGLTDHDLAKEVESHSELLSRLETTNSVRVGFVPDKMAAEAMLVDDDDDDVLCIHNFSDDTLFSSLNTPFAFPDSREISQFGFGDIIQPNLIHLQPSLDESMDTLTPMPEFNDFYDFVHGTSDRYNSRRTVDATVLGLTTNFGDNGFSSYCGGIPPSARQHQLGRSPVAPNSSSLASAEYIIDQISRQLMNETDSMTDLLSDDDDKSALQQSRQTTNGDGRDLANFATERDDDGRKTMTIGNSASVSSSFGGGANQFFDDIVERQRRTQNGNSRSSFNQMPPLSLISTDVDGQTRAPEVAGVFASSSLSSARFNQTPSGGDGRFFPATTMHGETQFFRTLPASSPHNGNPSSPSFEVQWRRPSNRPFPSSLSVASSSRRVEKASRKRLEPDGTGSANCLARLHHEGRDDGRYDCWSGRRGSTGSLAAPSSTKGKKAVSFALPSMPVSMASKTKRRILAPAPCDAQSKNTAAAAQGAASDGACHNARIHTNNEHGSTILAQLLTRGNTSRHFADGSSAAAQGQGHNQVQGPRISSPSATRSEKKTPGKKTVSQNRFLQSSSSSSVSDFQKNLLIGAANHALGVEKEKGTSFLFNSILSSDRLFCNSPTSSAIGSQNTSSLMNRSRHPSNNDSTASLTDQSSLLVPEHRREHRQAHHISAEQKRRCNIKYGFEALNQMVPELNAMSSGKINKAITLQKAAECCRHMKLERQANQREMDSLKRQIDELQDEISSCQSKLPATGVPALRPQTNQMQLLFEDYVRNRTLMNWKFWIFSFIIRPLFEAYNDAIVTSSDDAFCRSVLTWLQQHCSLVSLRPAVLKSLRELSTSTSILSDPSSVPQEATEAVSRTRNLSGSSAT